MPTKTMAERKTGQIIFKDLDGNLIMNRKSDVSYWDDEFIKYSLEADARAKGVRIITNDYKRGVTKINCTVDYLSRKR